MQRASKITKSEQLSRLQTRIEQRRPVVVTSKIYVHDKNPLKIPCICCGSVEATAVDVRDDLQLLIDPVRQQRKLRRDAQDPKEWDRRAKHANHYELKLRCTRQGLKILLDTRTRTIGLTGSARAGKTELSLSWLARQWMIRGGRGTYFWIIGPKMADAHGLMNKLIFGEGADQGRWSPPTLPTKGEQHTPALCSAWPQGERTTDQIIYMVDGSKIELKYAAQKNLRMKSISACIFSEAAEVKDNAVYSQLIGRLTDTRGQMLIESTPKETNHWTIKELQKKAIDDAEAVKAGKKTHVLVVHDIFLAPDNPWLTQQAIDEWEEMLVDPIMKKREFYGMPASGENQLWADTWNAAAKKNLLYDNELYDLGMMGMNDITEGVCYKIGFRKKHDFIIGQDINVYPCSSVICKVAGILNNPATWNLIVMKVFDNSGVTADVHASRLKRYRDGIFKDGAIIIDASACMQNPHAAHTGGLNVSSVAVLFEQTNFEVLPPKGDMDSPKHPGIADSVIVCKRIMRANRMKIERTRCWKLTSALEEQLTKDGRTAYKPPGSAHDRLSSTADCLRYVCWRVYGKEVYDTEPTLWFR